MQTIKITTDSSVWIDPKDGGFLIS